MLLGTDLPYLHLGATTSGTALYDNLRIDVIPEPGLPGLLGAGALVLAFRRGRRG